MVNFRLVYVQIIGYQMRLSLEIIPSHLRDKQCISAIYLVICSTKKGLSLVSSFNCYSSLMKSTHKMCTLYN